MGFPFLDAQRFPLVVEGGTTENTQEAQEVIAILVGLARCGINFLRTR